MQKRLSIFIDESGDFGKYDKNSPYYLVTMIFHDQSQSIAEQLVRLDESLRNRNHAGHYLHTGPLIRKEDVYKDMNIDERKQILNSFVTFATKIDFTYKTFAVDKKSCSNQFKLISVLSQQIRDFLAESNDFFEQFNKIIIYYDNGQKQLTAIIAALFNAVNTDFKENVSPGYYRLFQIADLITAFELINTKHLINANSKSEKQFFKNMRSFYKNYYKRLEKHKFDKT